MIITGPEELLAVVTVQTHFHQVPCRVGACASPLQTDGCFLVHLVVIFSKLF